MRKKHLLQIAVLILLAVVIYLIAYGGTWGQHAQNQANLIPNSGVGSQNGVPQIDPNSIGKIVTDPANGKQFLSNQIIVGFNSGVSEEDSLKIIASINGKMLQRFTQVALFLVQVPDSGDGKKALAAIATLKKDSRVDASNTAPNYLTTKDNTPPKP